MHLNNNTIRIQLQFIYLQDIDKIRKYKYKACEKQSLYVAYSLYSFEVSI